MVPIGLGHGGGARASMAGVILGGQMLGLLLALRVTPVTYSLVDGLGKRLGRVREWLFARHRE